MPIWSSLTPQAQLMLLAMVPIAEVRLAIPLGIAGYNLPIPEVMLVAILGNIIAASAVYMGLHAFGDILITRSPILHRYVEKYLVRARRVFTGKYERWGVAGLILFVGIPLPMTGGWTGAAVAYVFGFSKKKSLLAISLGIVLASIIMLVVTVGVGLVAGWVTSFAS